MDKSTAVKNLAAVSRRRFVKTFALGTAFSTVFGKVWRASVLADITLSGPGQLRIKLSDYPALQQDFGSVRIGINPIDNPIEALGPFYPILINHLSGTTYYALDTYCQHAGCIVPPYIDGEILCACHGSRYAIDGTRLSGEAVNSLVQYPITFDGVETLTVEVPNLGYTVETALVQSGNTPRLRLDFFSFLNVEYEVYFRERFQDDWVAIPFALTLGGTADQLTLTGDETPKSIFVNRTAPTGFYSVGIKLLDLTEG